MYDEDNCVLLQTNFSILNNFIENINKMGEIIEDYTPPKIRAYEVEVELGFGASGGDVNDEEDGSIGGDTPEYDYEDDEWD
ncbi:MAG: hypothetical protein IKK27_04135 [Alistipes sp.]|nr:hypothetical protein [Alistipes sp.]MBR4055339.1 hypothetical protein [Rikenellaceae bacterium]